MRHIANACDPCSCKASNPSVREQQLFESFCSGLSQRAVCYRSDLPSRASLHLPSLDGVAMQMLDHPNELWTLALALVVPFFSWIAVDLARAARMLAKLPREENSHGLLAT